MARPEKKSGEWKIKGDRRVVAVDACEKMPEVVSLRINSTAEFYKAAKSSVIRTEQFPARLPSVSVRDVTPK